MDLGTYIQLIFLCFVNVFFTFIGIILNSLVIISFWKSSQLRKKLCYLLTMVLSCVDILAILGNHPFLATSAILFLTEKYDLLRTFDTYMKISSMFFAFSLLTLLVMSFDRYLSTAYPIFHRKSVTKNRLLALLAILFILEMILLSISLIGRVFSYHVKCIIFLTILSPPFIFVNIKLFKIVRKMRKNNVISPKVTTMVKLKSISSCLLALACLVLLFIPTGIYIAYNYAEGSTSVNVLISGTWASTILSMNSTFNSLIFYWKNKILRTEGMKMLKKLKPRRHCTCFR